MASILIPYRRRPIAAARKIERCDTMRTGEPLHKTYENEYYEPLTREKPSRRL
jgi:hypothetical protein